MARYSMMDAKTAMPEKMKRENAANELMRRCLNTLKGFPDSEKDELEAINEFMGSFQVLHSMERIGQKNISFKIIILDALILLL